MKAIFWREVGAQRWEHQDRRNTKSLGWRGVGGMVTAHSGEPDIHSLDIATNHKFQLRKTGHKNRDSNKRAEESEQGWVLRHWGPSWSTR